MIFRQQWSEIDKTGAPVTVHKVDFVSQPEQVLFLRNMVNTYRHTNKIREWAMDAVRDAGCKPKHKLCQAIAIARKAQREIYYVNEGDETFTTPIRMIKQGFEDCDGFTTLICSALEAIGIPSELVAMWISDPPTGWRGAMEKIGMPWQVVRDGGFRHIFPRAVIQFGKRVMRVPLDATLRQPAGSVNPITMAAARGDKVRTLVL